MFRRPLVASLAAAALAVSLGSAPVEARSRNGAAIAGAIIGLAAGAVLTDAVARAAPREPVYGYPAYRAPAYEAEPDEPVYHAPRAAYRVARPARGYPPGYTVYEPDDD
jgi:hypothetical protein